MAAKLGMRMLVAAGTLFVAGSVAQAGVVVAWSGSGASGTDPLGNPWVLNSQGSGDGAWGIPGLFQGTVLWPDRRPVSDFHITFTLPQGVQIDSTPVPTGPGGSDESTRFSNLADGVLWTRTIVGNTVHFVAPTAGDALDLGDQFFVNVAFTTPVSSTNFAFEAEWTDDIIAVPLPSSALMGLGLLGALGGLAWRKRRAQTVASL